MNFLQSIIIAITSAAVVSIFNYLLTRDQEKRAIKMKIYTSLLDNARAFLDDPNLSKEERRKVKKEFLQKYYNEVILFADKDVRREIEDFIHTGGVSATNQDNQVTKLRNMIIAIRKDLGSNDEITKDFKMYSLDIGEERD
ncbi:MAG TPA: hypothetical protein VK153_02815 [Candidatus Paceibacterota bacterium]|nr:hypothetical protein [Candidatus Paceibacterota bacterium]